MAKNSQADVATNSDTQMEVKGKYKHYYEAAIL